nr:riboflavin synthase [Actinomycetota bacterium]
MFTGIIAELGTITATEKTGDSVRVTVRAPKAVAKAGHGDSIAISGVCLTVLAQTDDSFTADVMGQTITMSN